MTTHIIFISFPVSLYVSCICGGICLNGASPFFYELVCEACYPVAEGITGGLLTVIFNIFSIIFLFIPLIPNIGTLSVIQ